ncbi:MAG: hypothetical protein ACOYM9_07895 [Bradymonadia bacterium]
MAQCEVVRVKRPGRDLVEVRAAPAHEPLASCRFEWPARWQVRTCDWQPPPRSEPRLLFGLSAGPGDALLVSVVRFGLEVDALAWLEGWLGSARLSQATRVGWRGLSIALVDEGGAGPGWRAVLTGPSVHVLEAHGQARRWLDRAAATLRTLTPYDPPAEGFRPGALGGLDLSLPAAWRVDAPAPAPHGHAVTVLRRLTADGHLASWLRLHALDRRVHPGLNPAVLTTLTNPGLEQAGFILDAPTLAAGASGPVERRVGTWQGRSVETAMGVRQLGPYWLRVDGVMPGSARAPVTALNGRRVVDVALATAVVSPRS